MKKALSLMLCLILALGCLSATALTASADTMPRYIVLLLDVSGSMDKNDRIESEKEAALKFCQTAVSAEKDDKVAIVTFSDEITTVCEFTNDLDTLSTAINGIYPSGNTNFSDALICADELLTNEAAKGVDFERNIVLCSDGIPVTGALSFTGEYTSSDHSNYMYANAALEFDKTLWPTTNVYTIGFFQGLTGRSKTFGPQFMADLANKMSVVTDDADKLIETFEDFAQEIVKVETPTEPTSSETPTEPTSNSVQNPSNAASIAQAIQTGNPIAFAGIMVLALVAFGAMALTSKRREYIEK